MPAAVGRSLARLSAGEIGARVDAVDVRFAACAMPAFGIRI